MQPVHDSLSESAGGRAAPQLGQVNPAMALQEYESNGQGGLDALLEALDSSSDVRFLLHICSILRRNVFSKIPTKAMLTLPHFDLSRALTLSHKTIPLCPRKYYRHIYLCIS